MTIPFKEKHLRYIVTILDNYYTEDDGSAKILFSQVFKEKNDAEAFVNSVANDPKGKLAEINVQLSEDQIFHMDDIHVVFAEIGNIQKDVIASKWKW